VPGRSGTTTVRSFSMHFPFPSRRPRAATPPQVSADYLARISRNRVLDIAPLDESNMFGA
jgi:hypothetical protein